MARCGETAPNARSRLPMKAPEPHRITRRAAVNRSNRTGDLCGSTTNNTERLAISGVSDWVAAWAGRCARLRSMGAVEIDAVRLLERVLGGATAEMKVELESGPSRLVGGRSAELFRFRLSKAPAGLAGRDLVLRLLPDRAGSMDECVIQAAVAKLGYPAPEVVRAGSFDGTRTYMIMEYVEGTSLFEAQGPFRAFRRVPPRLAELMLALHRLDPAPVRQALAKLGAPAALEARGRALADVDTSLAAIEHPAHAALHRWFEQHQPDRGREVVCHGDLHALNVLVDGDTAVIDWELSALGDPAFDIARTKLLLHAVPMDLSRAARPLIQRLGQRAASRFEDAYTSTSPVPSEAIRWYEALHAARTLGLVLTNRAGSHPAAVVLQAWQPTLPLLARSLKRLTGVAVAA
jgi:aminoglycoside phosphotransferase (APT) family kinase protein